MSPLREWKTEQEIKALVHDSIATHPTITGFERRIGEAERTIDGFRISIEAKHQENRKTIHDLRDSQQTLLESIHNWQTELTEKFSTLELKIARATGWLAGAGFVIAMIWKWLEHVWK